MLFFSSREFSFVFAVVPQPVYMNMNDLKALAVQKQQQQHQQHQQFSDFPAEDSPELKTPTAEYTMVPEQKVGLFLSY